MAYCAPARSGGGGGANQTCFTINGLRKIASAYNHKRAHGPKNMIRFNNSTTKEELWRLIRERLSGECKTEWCWLDLEFLRDKSHDPEVYGAHRPENPGGKWEWLKTSDINRAMKQYEEAFPDFVFFGPVPIDFDEINTELSNIDLSRLYQKGIRKVGVVFNLDPHDQSGSHWVSLFLDLENYNLGYFDSYGVCPPPKEVQRLFARLNKSAMQIFGRPLQIQCNTHRHQKGNSECGVYCMYFISERLKGRSFDDITQNIIMDDEVNRYREVFFRPKGRAKGAGISNLL